MEQPLKENGKARIFLVDDHEVVRFGIRQFLLSQGRFEICGEDDVAGSALTAISNTHPDLVIADISLKESSGMELIRNLKAALPKLPVLVVSAHDEQLYAEMAFRAGAMGYLMKSGGMAHLLLAIERVLSGNIYVSDALAARMLQQQIRGQSSVHDSPVKKLTDREMEVFRMIGCWKTTGQIARELHLSVKTVEYYREQIKQKLSLRSAAELTQHATFWAQNDTP